MPWNPNAAGATSQQDPDNTYGAPAPAVLHPSAARTATGNSAAIDVGGSEAIGLELNVTAASGTTPTLVLSVEWSNDGTNFGPADPVDAFTQLTAAARRFKKVDTKARFMRLVWTIGGTTPSFTFVVNGVVMS